MNPPPGVDPATYALQRGLLDWALVIADNLGMDITSAKKVADDGTEKKPGPRGAVLTFNEKLAPHSQSPDIPAFVSLNYENDSRSGDRVIKLHVQYCINGKRERPSSSKPKPVELSYILMAPRSAGEDPFFNLQAAKYLPFSRQNIEHDGKFFAIKLDPKTHQMRTYYFRVLKGQLETEDKPRTTEPLAQFIWDVHAGKFPTEVPPLLLDKNGNKMPVGLNPSFELDPNCPLITNLRRASLAEAVQAAPVRGAGAEPPKDHRPQLD